MDRKQVISDENPRPRDTSAMLVPERITDSELNVQKCQNISNFS